MKTHPIVLAAAALLLALSVSSCESDGGVAARTQEKSAVYATLKPWQKKFIDKGTIAEGFTPDMVYIAMGKADKVETKEFPEGVAELWTYTHYYPNMDAIHGFRHAEFNIDSAYSPQPSRSQTDMVNGANPNATGARADVPVGADRGVSESIGRTGGPQGGSMEPADLRSYTIKVLFVSGKVAKIGADAN